MLKREGARADTPATLAWGREGSQGRPQAARRGRALTARATPRAPLEPEDPSGLRGCAFALMSLGPPWSATGRDGPSPGPEGSRGRQRRSSGAGHPYAAARQAWSGAAAARRAQSRGRPRRKGVMTSSERAPWLRPSLLTRRGPGNGSRRREGRRTPRRGVLRAAATRAMLRLLRRSAMRW